MRHFLGFGNGLAGSATISSDTTEAPIDASANGTVATKTLSATNASFAANQLILIMQMRGGTDKGKWELNIINSYTAGTITTVYDLENTYESDGADKQAQVRVINQNSNIEITSSGILRPKAWNQSTGGILVLLSSGDITINGSIIANGLNGTSVNSGLPNGSTGGQGPGFWGGNGKSIFVDGTPAWCGEGSDGKTTKQQTRKGSGGGAGTCASNQGAGGGGGASATDGADGTVGTTGGTPGQGGQAATLSDFTIVFMGGGGGGGIRDGGNPAAGSGGGGAPIVIIICKRLIINPTTGYIYGLGGDGGDHAGGGGGGGAPVLIMAIEADIGTNRISTLGGQGNGGGSLNAFGGDGGEGPIRIEACALTGSVSGGSYSSVIGGHDFCQVLGQIY